MQIDRWVPDPADVDIRAKITNTVGDKVELETNKGAVSYYTGVVWFWSYLRWTSTRL